MYFDRVFSIQVLITLGVLWDSNRAPLIATENSYGVGLGRKKQSAEKIELDDLES